MLEKEDTLDLLNSNLFANKDIEEKSKKSRNL
jgi:hypothetical protein